MSGNGREMNVRLRRSESVLKAGGPACLGEWQERDV
jgi:hypothetical protein